MDVFLFNFCLEVITTALLSILMYCGYSQKDMVSLLPTIFICSTDINVKLAMLSLEAFQTMCKSHHEQNRTELLGPFHHPEAKGHGDEQHYVLQKAVNHSCSQNKSSP